MTSPLASEAGNRDAADVLAQLLLDALPQTQCTRCGYPDCRGYADAIAHDGVAINRCPPGGAEGVVRLAALAGRPPLPLDPGCGEEGVRRVARIDEDWCIGCTLCMKACPVDCIVGGPKLMHTVIESACTGCDLCLPVCPVDCIEMPVVTGERTGWAAWSDARAAAARERYDFHQKRIARERDARDERLARKAQHKLEHLEQESKLTDPAELDAKRAVIEAAIARARAKAAGTPR